MDAKFSSRHIEELIGDSQQRQLTARHIYLPMSLRQVSCKNKGLEHVNVTLTFDYIEGRRHR